MEGGHAGTSTRARRGSLWESAECLLRASAGEQAAVCPGFQIHRVCA